MSTDNYQMALEQEVVHLRSELAKAHVQLRRLGAAEAVVKHARIMHEEQEPETLGAPAWEVLGDVLDAYDEVAHAKP